MHGSEVNAKDKNNNTPLHLTKSADITKLLLKNGATVDSVNNKGETPLHCCARGRDIQSFQLMVIAGSSQLVKNYEKILPLEYFVVNDNSSNTDRNLYETKATQEIASLLLEFELSLKWSAMASWWGGFRNRVRSGWLTSLIRCNKLPNLLVAVKELEAAIQWNAVGSEWRTLRVIWITSLQNVTKAVELAELLLTFVEKIKATSIEQRFFNGRWLLRLSNIIKRYRSLNFYISKETGVEFIKYLCKNIHEITNEDCEKPSNFILKSNSRLQAIENLIITIYKLVEIVPQKLTTLILNPLDFQDFNGNIINISSPIEF